MNLTRNLHCLYVPPFVCLRIKENTSNEWHDSPSLWSCYYPQTHKRFFLSCLPFAHLMQLYSEGQVKFNYQKKKEKREKNKNRRRPPFRVLITQLQGRSVGFIWKCFFFLLLLILFFCCGGEFDWHFLLLDLFGKVSSFWKKEEEEKKETHDVCVSCTRQPN